MKEQFVEGSLEGCKKRTIANNAFKKTLTIRRDKKLNYIIARDYSILSEEITDRVCTLIKKKPSAVILVPGCNTPLGFYKRLADKVVKKEIDISSVTFVTLDSAIDLAINHPMCFTRYMYDNFYRYIFGSMPRENDAARYLEEFYHSHPNFIVPYVPRGSSIKQAQKIAHSFGRRLEGLGYADLAILGLGKAKRSDGKLIGGHIAFNEPSSKIDSGARIVNLTEFSLVTKFRSPCAKELFGEQAVKDCALTQSITLGCKEILCSKEIIIAISGDKHDETNFLLNGEVTSDFPASYLQTAKDKTLVIVEERLVAK